MEFVPEKVDLNYLISRVVEAVRLCTLKNGHTLNVISQPGTLICELDVDRIEQTVEQLLDNAIRFTPDGGQIMVNVNRADGNAIITIADSGPGIPPESMPHIFERFWRLDEARSTPGFGLGLPIAQKIIERHGGVIEVESAPDQGTCFRVRLPSNAL